MAKKDKITVQGTEITIFFNQDNRNYICINEINRKIFFVYIL
jgi:hypothetical protein